MSVSLYNCGHCKLPQLVGQPCHCRTPEDEAFDELAKRQGDWGGGFHAKRAAAADKVFDLDGHVVGKARKSKPAHSEWNAALDEAAARIGEIKGFGQATQDSFAVFIQRLKR
jgi:hypothetical protein